MHLLSVPCIAMASVNFCVCVCYLYCYSKRPQIREHLPFALLCLSVGLYDLFSAGLYDSRSIHQGVFWQRLQLDTGVAISVFLIWFAGVFTRQKHNSILRSSIAWFILIFLASLFAGPGQTLSPDNPAVKNITVFAFPTVTYYEGAIGLVYQVEIISTVLVYLYLFYLFIRHYQRTKYGTLLLVLTSQTLYFLATLNDALVAMQFYSFIYISEYAFFFLILAMAYILFARFVQVETDKEKLEAQLIQLQKMEAIGRFAAGVVHDFNNVLCAVTGFASLLKQQVTGNDQGKHYVAGLLQAADQGMALIKSLLAFSSKKHSNPEPISLNTTIQKTEKMLSSLIGKGVRLRLELTEQNTTVYADSNQISQVLMNLAANARDSMQKGGALTMGTARVVLDELFVKKHGHGASGQYVVMTVADSGAGMDTATRHRIFEPFFTTKEPEKGTGLGLSIVHSIVKQYNGFIDVLSEVDRGTTVKVFLPAFEMKAVQKIGDCPSSFPELSPSE